MKSHNLYVYNTLSGKKEKFESIVPGYVGMYVCGPTVYSDVHLGNVRTFISFDVIYRYLKFLGYKVRYARNITDVGHLLNDADSGEDKIAKQAKLLNLEPMEVVQHYTVGFHQVMEKFNVTPPSIEPRATGHILEQIEAVQKIIDNGFAYEANGSVYFDVLKFNEQFNYGKLSGRKIEDLISNTRELDGQYQKRNSIDFAIWKKAEENHIMRWNSPWGEGFPGWHLECSVMSTKYLGQQFDIHGGGMDLKFPHHECEIAQNVGSDGVEPAKYWLHGNMLTVNGQKMSKSVGNVFTPEQLTTGNHELLDKGYSEAVVRFFCLQSHYTSTLDFSNQALNAAEKGFEKLQAAYFTLQSLQPQENSSVDVAILKSKCYAAMDDDFNTPILIANLFEGVKIINSVNAGKEKISLKDLNELKEVFNGFIIDVLGLKLNNNETPESEITSELMELIIEVRKNAKENKNYQLSDKIRDELIAIGVSLKDTREGTTWNYEK